MMSLLIVSNETDQTRLLITKSTELETNAFKHTNRIKDPKTATDSLYHKLLIEKISKYHSLTLERKI